MTLTAQRASDLVGSNADIPSEQVLCAPPPERSTWLILLLISLLFLAVNLATSTRSPTIWVDEAQLADPAVNVLMGRGFVSSGWATQTKAEVFAGNSPLYSYMLVPWLWLFGFHP